MGLRTNNYISSPKFNKLTVENVFTRLAEANLASKKDISDFI